MLCRYFVCFVHALLMWILQFNFLVALNRTGSNYCKRVGLLDRSHYSAHEMIAPQLWYNYHNWGGGAKLI